MISIDTNILVRLFINDESAAGKKQCLVARKFAEKEKEVYISQVVQLECVWVFKKAYKLTKNEIISILNELHENGAYTLENEEQFFAALTLFKNSGADFSDALTYVSSLNNNHMPFYTFDKRFAKYNGVKELGI